MPSLFKRLSNRPVETTVAICGGVFLMAAIVITWLYVAREQPFYVWDFRGRWDDLILLKQYLMYGRVSDFTSLITNSIYQEDYNISSALPMLPFTLLLGESRFVYIASIVVIYLLPLCLVTVLTIRRFAIVPLALGPRRSRWLLVTIATVSFLWAPFWEPTLLGYTDIGSIIPLALLYYLFYKGWFTQKITWWQNMTLGLLFWLPFLMRRWNAYTIVSFAVSIGLIILIRFLADKQRDVRTLLVFAKNGLVALGVVLVCLCLFQYGLVSTILATSYSDIYDAYQAAAQVHVDQCYGRTGIVTLILALIGAVGGLAAKQTRFLVALPLIQGVLYVYLFTRVQLLGIHHFLPVAFFLLVLVSVGLATVYRVLRKGALAITFSAIVVALYGINFVSTFFVKTDNPVLNALSRQHTAYPLEFEGYAEIDRLVTDLNRLLAQKNARYTVFASAIPLSDVTIWALAPELRPYLNETAHVDKVNKFNLDTLLSDYVVVTDRPMLQLPPDTQQVISIPNNDIYTGRGIGAAYGMLSGPYQVDRQTKAYIYAKKRDLAKHETERFMEQLYRSYPSWEEEYRSRIDDFLARQEAGHGVTVRYLDESNFPDKKKEAANRSSYVIDSSIDLDTLPNINKCRISAGKGHILAYPRKKDSFLNFPGIPADSDGNFTVWARIEVPVATTVHLFYTNDKTYATGLRNDSFVLRKGVNNVNIVFHNCTPGQPQYWAFLFGGFRQQFRFIDFPD